MSFLNLVLCVIPQEKWERGTDSSEPFTEDMLVERGVKDRYSIGFFTASNGVGVTGKRLVFEADRPQKLRVRSLKLSGNSQDPAGCEFWGLLVVMPEGQTPADMTLPSGTSPVWDLWEPASNILWSVVGAADYDNNMTLFDREWYGDGKIIDFKVGDAIWFINRTWSGTSCLCSVILDMDVVE